MKKKLGLGKILLKGLQSNSYQTRLQNHFQKSKKNFFQNKKLSKKLKSTQKEIPSNDLVFERHRYSLFTQVQRSHSSIQPIQNETESPKPSQVENSIIPSPQLTLPIHQPIASPLVQPQYQRFSLQVIDLIKPGETLRQSIEAFLLDQRSPHTKRAYGKDLKRFVKFLNYKNFTSEVSELNRTVLIAYKDSLLSEKLKHTTVDRHLATMRSFFQWLVDDGIISKSPAEGVRFLNPKRLSTTIGFTDEEVKKVLSMPDLHTRTGSMHYAILMILFYCGLRRSELCELKTNHISTERGQKILRLRGKGNSERIIVLIPLAWNALKHYFYIAHRNLDDNDFLFKPLSNNRTQTLKKPLDPSMIFYIVRRYAKLAGVSNRVSPHSCRATAISNARDHKVPDRAIQEFAGWASPNMITHYDKRRGAVEDSAAFSIHYGGSHRPLPPEPMTDKEKLKSLLEELESEEEQ